MLVEVSCCCQCHCHLLLLLPHHLILLPPLPLSLLCASLVFPLAVLEVAGG